MYVFRLCLRGEAENWINSLGEVKTLDELVVKFKVRFVGKILVLSVIKDLARMKFEGDEFLLGFYTG